MAWREQINAALPPPRNDEPKNLRRDILDELEDHLSLAMEEEERDAMIENQSTDEQSIRKRVIERFGNPVTIACQMWWEAMRGKIMRNRILASTAVCVVLCVVAMMWMMIGNLSAGNPELRSYTVEKKVNDYPKGRDLSTPERAYATIYRDCYAAGGSEADWSALSLSKVGDSKKKSEITREFSDVLLNAKIRDVLIYKDRVATVLAEWHHPDGKIEYDSRSLVRKDGKWFNTGHSVFDSYEKARDNFEGKCERMYWRAMEELGEEVKEKSIPVTRDELISNYLEPFYEDLSKINNEVTDEENGFKGLNFYTTARNRPALYHWWKQMLNRHDIVSIEYGPLKRDQQGFPVIDATVEFSNGVKLTKSFKFRFSEKEGWSGWYGLDWHLDPQWKDYPNQ